MKKYNSRSAALEREKISFESLLHLAAKRPALLSFLGLAAALFIFYPDLFLAQSASLMGDHYEQHYPWAFWMAQSLKKFEWPFWTPLIHCGFPMTAESQIGTFYLPNLLLYFFLPLRVAYSYTNVVHFLLSGFGTYLYARHMRLEPLPAFVAAFIFLFGTGYGGAYYNLTSLKTISWFPLSLFLFEKFLESRKWRYGLGLSVSLAMSFLAGYLQVAISSLGIFLLYGFLRILFFRHEVKPSLRRRSAEILTLFIATGLALILSLPQIYLTFQLALLSNRAGLSEGYAYVGSMSPFVLATLVLPQLQSFFRGNCLYGGMFSILLILFALHSKKARAGTLFRLWCLMAAVSFLLALGQWSPLYVGLIKLTRFYSFRTPMKFLIFICFSLALLSGIGFQEAWKWAEDTKPNPLLKKISRSFYLFIALFALAGFLIYLSLALGRPFLWRLGDWYLRRFIYAHVGHPHPWDWYRQNLRAYLEAAQLFFTSHDFWQLWSYAMTLSHLFFVSLLARMQKRLRPWLLGGLVLLFIDLFVFSWRDIKRDFNRYENLTEPARVLEILKKEKSRGRLGRIYGFRQPGESLALIPSVNMLYGIEDIGAYSPFVIKNYYETIGQFGNINDSNAAASPSKDFLFERINLLNFLDVSHLLSKQPLEHPNLRLVSSDKASGFFLYENKAPHARAYFISRFQEMPDWKALKQKLMEPGFDPAGVVLLEKLEAAKIEAKQFPAFSPHASLERKGHDSGRERWRVKVNQAGFFVLTNTAYPGWRAHVNHERALILKAYGLFQALWLKQAGIYEIELDYQPFRS